MGTYIYKIRPSNTIDVEGLGESLLVHCAEYAYKPYGAFTNLWDVSKNRYLSGESLNRKMHFKSGAQACDNAWKRRQYDPRPMYVTLEDADSIKKAYPFGGGTRYGTGAKLYYYDERNAAGHFYDDRIGWHVGWIYWSEWDDAFILQYRQLNAFDDDPRRAAAS